MKWVGRWFQKRTPFRMKGSLIRHSREPEVRLALACPNVCCLGFFVLTDGQPWHKADLVSSNTLLLKVSIEQPCSSTKEPALTPRRSHGLIGNVLGFGLTYTFGHVPFILLQLRASILRIFRVQGSSSKV